MEINWTPEQRKVIESRNRSLLVSAAAGSGKTAVLVERIVRMITEGESPLNIDQLLVMTFTKAAAAEMRERVSDAIDRKLTEEPDNIHLRIQAAMVPYAQITTIDSFCLNIIREHYNRLDIDPSFSVGDEGELLLMKADVMKDLLESYYESQDQDFAAFVDSYAQGKTDKGIEDLVMQVYIYSQSNPWPSKWLDSCRKELEHWDAENLCSEPWMKFLLGDARLRLEELARQMETALLICREEDGPCAYEPMIINDIRLLHGLGEATDYETLSEQLRTASLERLAAVRSKEVDPDKKASVTASRDRVKKTLEKMKEQLCAGSVEEVTETLKGTRKPVEMLLRLTEDFSKRYQEAKRDKNLVDFNDLEHLCLLVLLKEEDGALIPTETADELANQYEEILVDEYQDSNEVQEALVQSISRERLGQPNVFMVGDVKQSIYKFRLARPELFLDKYRTYPAEDGPYQKIELHQNFRSREEVLRGINDVFYQIMTEPLGSIEYTEDTALHPGADYPEAEGRICEKPQLLMVHTDGDYLKQLDEDMADYTSRELEARLIAQKIRELTDEGTGLLIWDKREKAYRTARLCDIVILLRSTSGWAEEFVNVLMNEGISAYAQLQTGYFTTVEVETVLSLLHIIDNPMQDIPLAAVMKSPMAGLTDEDLAYLTAFQKKRLKKGQDRGLYGAWKLFMKAAEGEADDGTQEVTGEVYSRLYGKLKPFSAMMDCLTEKSEYLAIHELLYDIFESTGYYDYVSAMPAGDGRRANLDMLVEKAAAYERTSYTGLFNFIRYIEKLQKYEMDFGEASVTGEEDTVRIMSIHKSKGLEFPVVFLAGMGKKFNKQDVYGKILIDPELGIGTDYVDLENRLKSSTLKKQALRRKMELDSLGEELRVLYVAMTRAKEKLIMTGTDRYLDKKLERYADVPRAGNQVPFTYLSSADSYLDWALMSLSGKLSADAVLGEGGLDCGSMTVSQISVSQLIGHEMVRQEGKRLQKETLLNLDRNQIYDEAYRTGMKGALGFHYPYEFDVGLHAKLSVSELKKQSQVYDEESEYLTEILPAKPETRTAKALLEGGGMGRQHQSAGAFRGSAYHRVLELLDFGAVHSREDLYDALKTIKAERKMEEESLQLLDGDTLYRFLTSSLGRRMSMAQSEGRLYREQQFVMGITARDMDLGDSDELVLIQGIIDAYFEEDGGLVLMDYKTDRVETGEELVKKYRIQLEYYKRALEQMTGKKVKEKVIYSLRLQQEIEII